MSVAFVFPGQGPDLRDGLARLPQHPAVQATLEEARQTLGADLDGLDQDPALHSLGAAQPLMVLLGVCVARALMAQGVEPAMVGGLSIGAFGAAVCSGALALGDALELVHWRGRWMEAECPEGFGMAVLAGWPESRVQALLDTVPEGLGPVWVANLNAVDQYALSGRLSGLDWVLARALQHGVRRAERLPVQVPSHCPLMAPVSERLRQRLATLPMIPPQRPYLSNVGARVLYDAEAIRSDLAANVSHPVRWAECTEIMVSMGCTLFLEMPPGHVLSRLAQTAYPALRSLPTEGLPLSIPCRLARQLGA